MKISTKKQKEIATLLNTEKDAQYLTWTQLGTEVSIKATRRTVRDAIKEKRIVDSITKQRTGVTEQTATKRVEQAEG